MNKFVERLQVINERGIKSPKILLQKLQELEQVEKIGVNEFTTARKAKLSEAVNEILAQLEAKTPKDTRVSYGVSGVLDDSAMSKRALSYNRTVYALHLLDVDYQNRRQAFERKLANIQDKIPTGQIVEFRELLTKMSASEFESLPVVTEEEETETA